MSLRTDIKDKSFVYTAELNPPKSTNPNSAIENAKKIKDLVSAINITDNSGANMKMCPMVLSYLVQKEAEVETIWQMTCRDRNRLGLQSDLLGGVALGLKNLLPLRGDDPKQGDHPETSQSYDFQTEELIKAINNLGNEKDFNENPVAIEPKGFSYCVGSAAHPGLPDLQGQKETMLRRIDLGVEFFQTQICFEKEQISKFAEIIGSELTSKTLLGITPLKTFNQAKFINDNIFGVKVSDLVLESMQAALGELDPKSDEAKQKQQETGLVLAKDLVDHVKALGFKGAHVMAIGQEASLDKVIQNLN